MAPKGSDLAFYRISIQLNKAIALHELLLAVLTCVSPLKGCLLYLETTLTRIQLDGLSSFQLVAGTRFELVTFWL